MVMSALLLKRELSFRIRARSSGTYNIPRVSKPFLCGSKVGGWGDLPHTYSHYTQ